MTKIHRFIGPYQLGQGTMRIDDVQLCHQMRSVLKLEPGEIVIIGDGTGTEAHCRIISFERGIVFLQALSIGRNAAELPGRTILYCALLKADHFEQAVAAAVQAGVTEIVPLHTRRTVKLNLRSERIENIVREAAELAGRGRVPALGPVADLDKALTHASRNDVNFFFDPSGKPFAGVAKSVRQACLSGRQAGVFVGPEGGWDDAELKVAADSGVRLVSLGALTLRAETAVTVASYLVAHSAKL